MIRISVFTSRQGYTGFKVLGHAGYADAGEDIVCSAVSVLVINTINSIEAFTKDGMEIDTDEDSGLINVRFLDKLTQGGELLIKSMILGLETIQNDYNNRYIHLNIEEV